jgi:hypothetical protein
MSLAENVCCAVCGTTAYPSIVLSQNFALVPSCPACGAEHRDIQANDMSDTPFAPQEKTMSPVTPIRRPNFAPPTIETPPIPSDPVDLLSQIRSRIQFLEYEIAKAAGYAAERKQLVRMIAAAGKSK